jgi:hypothetical protein
MTQKIVLTRRKRFVRNILVVFLAFGLFLIPASLYDLVRKPSLSTLFEFLFCAGAFSNLVFLLAPTIFPNFSPSEAVLRHFMKAGITGCILFYCGVIGKITLYALTAPPHKQSAAWVVCVMAWLGIPLGIGLIFAARRANPKV